MNRMLEVIKDYKKKKKSARRISALPTGWKFEEGAQTCRVTAGLFDANAERG